MVITFTKAAAEELQERITQDLRGELEKLEKFERSGSSEEKGGQDSKETAAVKTALYKVDTMNISTIHSFCNRILRENAFQAGVSLNVEIMEDEDNETRLETFFHSWSGKHGDLLEPCIRLIGPSWRKMLYGAFRVIAEEHSEIVTDPYVPQELQIRPEKELLPLRADLAAADGNAPVLTKEEMAERASLLFQIAHEIRADFRKAADSAYDVLSNDDLLFRADLLVKEHLEVRERLRE